MAILVLTESKGAVFYNIKVQLAYLCIAVGMNIIYTILVVGRLLSLRSQIKEVLGPEHAKTYTSIAAMVIESAAMYSVLGVLYIASFSKNSDLSNLIFLDISHVQVCYCIWIVFDIYVSTRLLTNVISMYRALRSCLLSYGLLKVMHSLKMLLMVQRLAHRLHLLHDLFTYRTYKPLQTPQLSPT